MRAILYHKLGMLSSEHLWLNAPVNNTILKGQCNECIQRLFFLHPYQMFSVGTVT